MAKTLTERFTAALGANARASDVEALINLISGELVAATDDATTQHATAIDVRSDDATADAAADAESKARRRITRLEGQRTQLEDRLTAIRDADQRREWEVRAAEIAVERDTLARDLEAEWPLLEAKMLHLLWRILASDQRQGPGGTSAEAIARGLHGNFSVHGMPVHRLIEMQLPSFKHDGWSAWPVRWQDLDKAKIDPAEMEARVASAAARVAELEQRA